MKKKKEIKMPSDREAVILQILISGEKYGLQLREEYERRTKESMPLGSLYTTMRRMEEAGYVTNRYGEEDDTHDRGGNRRKYFKIEGDGIRAVDLYREALHTKQGLLGRLASALLFNVIGKEGCV